MLTVACVLKSGGVYDANWVARLRAQVARHLLAEHRFLCLSDVAVPCERLALRRGWAGWWSKIELFGLAGPVLYFDLDTIIVGDLSDLAAAAERTRFAMLRDFYRPAGLGSGVMAWDAAGETRALGEIFGAAPEDWMRRCGGRGDQAFIEQATRDVERLQDLVPGQIISFKADRCGAARPPGARVICFHGQPKQNSLPGGHWARDLWERAA